MNCLECLNWCTKNKYATLKKENLSKEITCCVIRIISSNKIIISYHNELTEQLEYYNVKLNNVKTLDNKNSEAIRALIYLILNKHVTINNITTSTQMEIHGDIIFENINVNAWLIYNNLATYEKK